MTSVLFTLSIRTRNPLNMSTGNTRVAAILRTRERSVNRHVAWINALNAMRKGGLSSVDLVPCVVHLTRISSGKMDDDGLAASCKGIRDGIADALGVNDGGPFIRYVYAQRKAPRGTYGVEVRIARVEQQARCAP